MKINENIALAKSILRKNSISETDGDYLKIKELVGKSVGYIGILTRLRYVDNVIDLDEIESIYEVLKNSNIDVSKLSKMSYNEILDTFYDELIGSKSNENYELIYKDEKFSYFKVYTYEGILQIGSPAWCIKTKSNWLTYQSKYPTQWVVISNDYVKNIMSPNNFYLNDKYINEKKAWIRYGISQKNEGKKNWVAFDDNDEECVFNPKNYTFFGVLLTISNLENGIKESYYDRIIGCDYIAKNNDNYYHLIKDRNFFKVDDGDGESYIITHKYYDSSPVILLLEHSSYPRLKVFNEDIPSQKVTNKYTLKIIKDFVEKYNKKRVAYISIKIFFGIMTVNDAKKYDDFVHQIGKWLIYHWNSHFFFIVNSEPSNITLVSSSNRRNNWGTDDENDLMFYFIDKKKLKNSEIDLNSEDNIKIIKFLKDKKNVENPSIINKFTKFIGMNK